MNWRLQARVQLPAVGDAESAAVRRLASSRSEPAGGTEQSAMAGRAPRRRGGRLTGGTREDAGPR